MVCCTKVRGSEQFQILPDFGLSPHDDESPPWDMQDVFLPHWCASGYCKLFLVVGVLVFTCGVSTLTVNSCVAFHKGAFGKNATLNSETLTACQEASTVLLCLVGLMMAAELLFCLGCKTKPQPVEEMEGVHQKVVTNAPSPAAGVAMPVTLSEVETVQV